MMENPISLNPMSANLVFLDQYCRQRGAGQEKEGSGYEIKCLPHQLSSYLLDDHTDA